MRHLQCEGIAVQPFALNGCRKIPMVNNDIAQKFWILCNLLRDDGINSD